MVASCVGTGSTMCAEGQWGAVRVSWCAARSGSCMHARPACSCICLHAPALQAHGHTRALPCPALPGALPATAWRSLHCPALQTVETSHLKPLVKVQKPEERAM